MKSVKKFIAIFIAAVMTASFAGCGGSNKSYEDNGDSVTLKFILPWETQSDLSVVNDKVNEILPNYLENTKLEIICDGAMSDKWALYMSGKNVYDIAHSGFATNLTTEIRNGNYIELDSLIDEYAPEIKKERDELYKDLYLSGSDNGKLYAIPAIQTHCNKFRAVSISKDMAPYVDADAIASEMKGKTHVTEKVYQLVDDALNKAKAATGHSEIFASYMWENCPAKIGYVFVGGTGSNLCYDPYKENAEIIDWHQTDEFKTYCKYMQKWYQEGFINKDVLAGAVPKDGATIWLAANVDGYNFENGDVYTLDDGSAYIRITFEDTQIKASYELGDLQTYLSIPATSKNPVRAIKLINILRTEEGADLLNLITFGIEGTHYDKISDIEIKAKDYTGQGSSSSKYGIPGWMMGNMLNGMYTVYPYTSAEIEYANNYYQNILPNIKKTALYGFSFDTSDYKIQFTNIKTANDEYERQLGLGVASDFDGTLKKLTDSLNSAGMEEVISAMQKQADDYVK